MIYLYGFLIDIDYFNSKNSGEGQENTEDLDHDYDLYSDLDFVEDIFVLVDISWDFAEDIGCYDQVFFPLFFNTYLGDHCDSQNLCYCKLSQNSLASFEY